MVDKSEIQITFNKMYMDVSAESFCIVIDFVLYNKNHIGDMQDCPFVNFVDINKSTYIVKVIPKGRVRCVFKLCTDLYEYIL